MASQFALRIKTKSGQHVLRDLTPTHTIKDLKAELSKLVPEDRLHVLSGFPPKVLDLSQDSVALSQSGLKSGDTLILEEKTPPVPAKPAHKAHVAENNESYPGILMRKVVPADNSCLFSSMHFALNGALDETGTSATYMREMIATTVAGNPEEYSDAFLEKSNADYCAWILDDKSWGGAIELSILSLHYGLEIVVVNTIHAIINRFGEDQHYPLRIFLMFDGIHYDPLYLEAFDSAQIQTIFQTSEEKILTQALDLAKEANSSRQFTDVQKFTLKCMQCNVFLTGQTQASAHAKETGHQTFGEV